MINISHVLSMLLFHVHVVLVLVIFSIHLLLTHHFDRVSWLHQVGRLLFPCNPTELSKVLQLRIPLVHRYLELLVLDLVWRGLLVYLRVKQHLRVESRLINLALHRPKIKWRCTLHVCKRWCCLLGLT